MTVRSITAQGADSYAQYLDAKTVAPELGDYYLGRDGEPVEAPGRWHAHPETLRAIGINPGAPVAREDLVALMQGRRPGSDEYLRPAGPTGSRNAGVDVVLSAPKSVSVAWALSDPEQRAAIEDIHHDAVTRTIGYLRDTVELTTRREGARNTPARARDLLAAEFRHSTARGLAGRVPDPQLHSHVLVTSVVRKDGQVAAVRDRQMYRAAREGGAYYRAALAEGLARTGYAIQAGTGKDGRYFELAGVRPEAVAAFSGRSREIDQLVRRFEAREGRKPSEAELQIIKVDSRHAKLPRTGQQLTAAWQQAARDHGQPSLRPAPVSRFADRDPEWGGRVEQTLTIDRATFQARELRAAALEQAAGTLAPETALRRVGELRDAGRVLRLEGGAFTTRTLRSMELSIAQRAAAMSSPAPGARRLPAVAVGAARTEVAERLGAPLSDEQERAVHLLTGPGQIAALEGQAGTGKGVVIDTVARAEQHAGRQVLAVATAGATAQRLGEDCPSLAGHTTTIASLLARQSQTGRLLAPETTVIVDEAGMIDTPTLEALVRVSQDSGAKLIAVGDGKQLPAIGPGGMFDQLTARTPKATLTQVRRTADPEERKAWRALRRGQPEQAMAHYLARGQLHLTDTRDTALEQAAQRYLTLTRTHPITQVALISDGTTSEVDRLNARVQQLRHERGELGRGEVAIPDTNPDTPAPHYALRRGDLVAWTQIQPVPGQVRVENGTRGVITHADPAAGEVGVRVLGSGRDVTVTGEQVAGLRLAYAQHVVRQQGATVDRAIAVTGGWQTSREAAYVKASRARHGIDWHVARDQLGQDGTDTDRIERLAEKLATSRAKTPSLTHQISPGQLDPALTPPQRAPLPQRRIAGPVIEP